MTATLLMPEIWVPACLLMFFGMILLYRFGPKTAGGTGAPLFDPRIFSWGLISLLVLVSTGVVLYGLVWLDGKIDWTKPFVLPVIQTADGKIVPIPGLFDALIAWVDSHILAIGAGLVLGAIIYGAFWYRATLRDKDGNLVREGRAESARKVLGLAILIAFPVWGFTILMGDQAETVRANIANSVVALTASTNTGGGTPPSVTKATLPPLKAAGYVLNQGTSLENRIRAEGTIFVKPKCGHYAEIFPIGRIGTWDGTQMPVTPKFYGETITVRWHHKTDC